MHAISCTGANLEKDIFNLAADSHYVRIPIEKITWEKLSVDLQEYIIESEPLLLHL